MNRLSIFIYILVSILIYLSCFILNGQVHQYGIVDTLQIFNLSMEDCDLGERALVRLTDEEILNQRSQGIFVFHIEGIVPTYCLVCFKEHNLINIGVPYRIQ